MRSILLTCLMLLIMAPLISQEAKSAEDAKGLKAGAEAPDFTAKDAAGSSFHLKSVLESGPVVMIFYRGHWCPYCNEHLGVIQDSLELIMDKGATVIAVSPQNPEFLDMMAEKSGATFRLLYDKGYTIANAYDVSFTSEKKRLKVYNAPLNADKENTQSDESYQLPIPATYIVAQDGKIAWRHFDPNYKNRSSVKMILDNLPGHK